MFWHKPIEEVISARRDKFVKRYCALDYYLCQLMLNIRSTLSVLMLLALFLILFIYFNYFF